MTTNRRLAAIMVADVGAKRREARQHRARGAKFEATLGFAVAVW